MKFAIPQAKPNKFLKIIGGAKEMFGRLSFYIQLGTMAMVAVGFWETNFIVNIRTTYAWFTFPVFIVLAIILILLILVIEYVFIIVGSYAFANAQFNKHANELTMAVREMKVIQKEQGEKIDALYEDLEKKHNG